MTLRLTKSEKSYLRCLRQMERDREPVHHLHRRLCEKLHLATLAESFDLMTVLEMKGFITKGARLALVSDVPVVAPKGRRELAKAA